MSCCVLLCCAAVAARREVGAGKVIFGRERISFWVRAVRARSCSEGGGVVVEEGGSFQAAFFER